jgi:hypothetical protein
MSTESQIDANRRNAQKSTGPRTPEGKSISSANALKHGLASGFRVLQAENQEEFDKLIAKYRRDFAPANSYEESLVEEMAQSRWRLARARRLEAHMLDAMLDATSYSDSDTVLVFALLNNHAGPFVVIQRYIAAAERTGYRAHKQLSAIRRQEARNKAQAARDSAQPNEPNLKPGPEPTASTHTPRLQLFAPPKPPQPAHPPAPETAVVPDSAAGVRMTWVVDSEPEAACTLPRQ